MHQISEIIKNEYKCISIFEKYGLSEILYSLNESNSEDNEKLKEQIKDTVQILDKKDKTLAQKVSDCFKRAFAKGRKFLIATAMVAQLLTGNINTAAAQNYMQDADKELIELVQDNVPGTNEVSSEKTNNDSKTPLEQQAEDSKTNTVLPFTIVNNLIVIRTNTFDNKRIKIIVDTGASFSICYNKEIMQNLKNAPAKADIVGINGKSANLYKTGKIMAVGVGVLSMYYSPDQIKDFDIILGADWLIYNNVSIDYANHYLIVRGHNI